MNKKGFTLIELLAVIIILGILMIIAIPSVTKYINDSRKSSYVDTAKELIGSARNLVNKGDLGMYDTDTTYYIDIACLKTENGGKAVSPYGDFVDMKAFVVVTFDGKGYEYFWTSVDESGEGITKLIKYDKLDPDNIESDLKPDDIKTDRGIDGRSQVVLVTERNHCQKEGAIDANEQIDGKNGEHYNLSVNIKSYADAAGFTPFGTTVWAEAEVINGEKFIIEYKWYCSSDGKNWVDISNLPNLLSFEEDGHKFYYVLTYESWMYLFKVEAKIIGVKK